MRSWSARLAIAISLQIPAVVVLNPDDDVTPETFAAWLDRGQLGEPVDPGVTAAETLAGTRASAEA